MAKGAVGLTPRGQAPSKPCSPPAAVGFPHAPLPRAPKVALLLTFSIAVPTAGGQESSSSPDEPPAEPLLEIEEEIDVLSLTPVSETGIDPERFPWSLHQLDSITLEEGDRPSVTQILARRVPGVHTNAVQNNPLQDDLFFRGFSSSPLLGSSQGLSIWEDGVRVNEVFGDIVQWNLLPVLALERMELIAGAHAAYGPNTLGGALSLRTKRGTGSPRGRFQAGAGSWGRRQVGVESGAVWGSWSAYGAGEVFEEEGWRDFSPSESQHLFGKLSYENESSSWDLGVGWASGRLTGNGTAPVELLEIDRSEVFTHPDETDNDLFFPRFRWQRNLGSETLLEAVAFYRGSDISTFNADELELDDGSDAEPDDEDSYRPAPAELDGANNRSRTDQTGYGASVQITLSGDLLNRPNHLGLGATWEEGEADFRSSTELAFLTEDRTTIGTGIFDPESFVAVDADVRRSAVFATDSLQLSQRVTLTAEARYDSSSVRLRDRLGEELDGDHEYGRLNGALGAAIDLRPGASDALVAFAGLSRSSRNPTPVELTCADPEDPCRLPNAFVADPPLDDVVTTSLEAGLRGRWRRGSWSASYFDATSDDEILFVSSGRLTNAGHFTNVDSTRRRGIDVSLHGRAGRHSWFAGYTWVDATLGTDLVLPSTNHPDAIDGEIAVRDGDTLPGVPRHLGKAGLSLVFGPWGVVASTSAQSSRYLRGDEANLLEPVVGFVTAEMETSWTPRPWITVALGIENVFDTEYETFGVLGDPQEVLGDDFTDPRFLSPGAPRSVRLSVDLRPFDRPSP